MHCAPLKELTGLACLTLLIAACGNTDGRDIASAGEVATLAGLPPGAGGGDQTLQTTLADPAPAGTTILAIRAIAEGLENPWSVSFFPENIILVTERPGRVRMIRDGVLQQEPVPGAPVVLDWNQGGLFDILPHPDYAENQTIFISYAAGTKEANATEIARARFDGAVISGLEVIYRAVPEKDTGHHFGGRLVWGPDDHLYLTVGEGSKYKEKAQDLATSFGAVIRIAPDGSIPADNPDFGPGAAPGLYSKGHRNGQGLVFDEARGILWEHEHGARGGDEINIVEPGKNYGWPIATYGIDYNGALISPFTEYENTVQPVKYWTPSIAPSGLAVYRGNLFTEWQADLLVGALAGRALHRVIMDGEKPIGEERYLIGERVRDVRVGPEGAIYVTTEDRGGEPSGKVLKLTPQ